MPGYVVRIEGKLEPQMGILHKNLTLSVQSFSLTVNEDKVSAIPNTGVQLEPGQGEQTLQREIVPLLAALAYENGREVNFRITNAASADPTSKGAAAHLHASASVHASASISLQVNSKRSQDIVRQAEWATTDQTYRELLNLAAEAMASPNPRPSGYKIVERLEVKYGSRKKACAQLGIKPEDLKPLVADQSQYAGDRHAEYPLGAEPALLDPIAKSEALAVIKRVIE